MLQHHQIVLNNVSLTYDSSTKELISGLSAGLTSGWTKTTLLKLATGILKPSSGGISISGKTAYCRQRIDTVPEMLPEL